MPTVEERLTRLEEGLHSLRNHTRGGDDVAWERSVDGRIYDLRQAMLAADKLSEALRDVRRERARRWSRREKAVLFVAAVVAAAAPYVLIVLHASGSG